MLLSAVPGEKMLPNSSTDSVWIAPEASLERSGLLRVCRKAKSGSSGRSGEGGYRGSQWGALADWTQHTDEGRELGY